MSPLALAIAETGLVTSVGMTSASSCAAFRAKITNPTDTRFLNSEGDWIVGHQVPLTGAPRGVQRLAAMAALAAEEALQSVERKQWSELPVLLCVAEVDRVDRLKGLDDGVFHLLQCALSVRFSELSCVIAQGRVSVAIAMMQARQLLGGGKARQVLIVATDSLLSGPALDRYDRARRLLTEENSNGVIPGEAAGAFLVRAAVNVDGEFICTGVGFGRETAHIDSDDPLRADGLAQAVKAALADAECTMGDIDFRITDNAGEHYYFKESALTLSRTLRARKEDFDHWHPAECTGEVGAACGATIIAAARTACLKGYSRGSGILSHMSNDEGQRAALVLRYRGLQ